MSDCCSKTNGSCSVPEEKGINAVNCPSCRQKGKTVDTQTVKALLSISLEAVEETTTYRFCRTPNCPAVYFNAVGGFFTEAQLREQVYQKHPESEDVLVCYCYQHTPGSIRAEVAAYGKTDVVARVTAGTKAGTCACDIRNPQGSCCLGNVGTVVKLIKADMNAVPA